jgi:hypothetical protein
MLFLERNLPDLIAELGRLFFAGQKRVADVKSQNPLDLIKRKLNPLVCVVLEIFP